MSESPPETNGTNRRDEEKSQKEIINFYFEKKLLSGILFSFLDSSWGMHSVERLEISGNLEFSILKIRSLASISISNYSFQLQF